MRKILLMVSIIYFTQLHASDVIYRVNGGATVPLSTNPISEIFSGPASLQGAVCSYNCNLHLDIEIQDIASVVTVFTVKDAYTTGGFLCNSAIDFRNFDWTGAAGHSIMPGPLPTSLPVGFDDPVEFDLGLFEVEFLCGAHCIDNVRATFINDPARGASIALNSVIDGVSGSPNCSIYSQLSPGNFYEIWHP